MKLDFIVPGFSKCGTTSLCWYLAQHPDIYMPEVKEPNFFAFGYGFGWEWYEALFENTGAARIVGEGSTFYSAAEFENAACERILRHFPEIRLIFIARDPIARIESSYRELHHSGYRYGVRTPFTIFEALRQHHNIIADTLYWRRINAYRRHLPDSRIHVLFLEDLRRDPATELAKCFRFLGVDPKVRIEHTDQKLNDASTKLCDSRLMALIRSHRLTNWLWNRFSVSSQNKIGRLLGLRKAFCGPIQWDPVSLDWVRQEVFPDSRQFLSYYRKPPGFWDLRPKAIAA
jgi:hypothetical protein